MNFEWVWRVRIKFGSTLRRPISNLAGSGKVLGFATNLVLLALLTLLTIPAMIAAEGSRAWGSIAIGQSIGVIASVAIMYGWNLVGPAFVANATPAELIEEYRDSLRVRSALTPIVLVPSVAVSVLLSDGYAVLAVLGCISTAVLGLRGNWVFVGKGAPYLLLVYETIPRSLGLAAGLAGMQWLGLGGGTALVLQIGGCLAAVLVTTLWLQRHTSHPVKKRTRRAIRSIISERRHGVLAAITSALYGAAPMIVVSLVSPAALPTFALLSRIQAQTNTAISPLGDFLQGWVPRAPLGELQTRIRRALLSVAALSAIGLVLFALVGPGFVSILGASTIVTTYSSVVLLGAAIALSTLVQVSGRAGLVPLGAIRALSINTFLAATVGVICVTALTTWFGVTGALSGLLIGLSVHLATNLIALRTYRGNAT